MTDTIEFGKRINHRPITISLILSFIAGALGFITNIKISILSFLSVLFLLLCVYFPINLRTLFGHWQLENHGISYYKMNSYRDKLKLILFPNSVDFQFISFSQIKSFQVIERETTYSLSDILTIKPAKQSYFPWARKPFLLKLELNKSDIYLDLSFDQLHDSKNTLYRLSNVLKVLDQKIN
ncbi:hypothetical protein [Companilactobacillus kimchiensis]|uniref:Uncharacterized protein n=1 Tax=Companilactobacillus kimchiensis TaxID=993692 RepID=A0A0R2LEC6_9LACO|nr:hypothetical protein [Companilactobacillus kimchiensis]KRO00180.1 hypothetical protein IV57_GL001831 [Companilactobacillus kimchiensis]